MDANIAVLCLTVVLRLYSV